MKALDTNVILRIVDRTDPAQSARVEQLVRHSGEGPFFLNSLVLLEFAWTLSRRYKLSRATIADWLHIVIEAPEFVLERRPLIVEAVQLYETTKADFADCLIGATNLASGCSTTLTFDPDAAAIDRYFAPVPL